MYWDEEEESFRAAPSGDVVTSHCTQQEGKFIVNSKRNASITPLREFEK